MRKVSVRKMPASARVSSKPKQGVKQGVNMEASDYDFTELAKGVMASSSGVGMDVDVGDRNKRSLTRGDSDTKPPQSKARAPDPGIHQAAAIPVPTGDEQSKESDTKEDKLISMMDKLFLKMEGVEKKLDATVQDLKDRQDVVESKIENIRTDMKEVVSDVTEALDRTRTCEKAINELKGQMLTMQTAVPAEQDNQWPRLEASAQTGKGTSEGYGKNQPLSNAGEVLKFPGQDCLIIGGYPKNSNRQLREKAADLVLRAIPNGRRFFEKPVALYDAGRVCSMKKLASSSWGVMQQTIQEYKDHGEVTITVDGKSYTLWMGFQKSPERRRRNTRLRMLATRAEENGAKNVSIDWWGGNLLVGGYRVATVKETGETTYVANQPFLEALETERWFQDQERILRSARDWRPDM